MQDYAWGTEDSFQVFEDVLTECENVDFIYDPCYIISVK